MSEKVLVVIGAVFLVAVVGFFASLGWAVWERYR
jgi:hypothetical protein